MLIKSSLASPTNQALSRYVCASNSPVPQASTLLCPPPSHPSRPPCKTQASECQGMELSPQQNSWCQRSALHILSCRWQQLTTLNAKLCHWVPWGRTGQLQPGGLSLPGLEFKGVGLGLWARAHHRAGPTGGGLKYSKPAMQCARTAPTPQPAKLVSDRNGCPYQGPARFHFPAREKEPHAPTLDIKVPNLPPSSTSTSTEQETPFSHLSQGPPLTQHGTAASQTSPHPSTQVPVSPNTQQTQTGA